MRLPKRPWATSEFQLQTNQAATDAKQRPGFQTTKSGKIFEKNAKHMSVKLELLILLIVLGFVVSPRLLSWQSFWKAGSARNGSQIGSSLRRAGVMGAGL